jgi:hypothetical protein
MPAEIAKAVVRSDATKKRDGNPAPHEEILLHFDYKGGL